MKKELRKMTEFGVFFELAREIAEIKAELEHYYDEKINEHTREIIELDNKIEELKGKLSKIEKQIYAINKRLDEIQKTKSTGLKIEHEKI